MSTAVLVFLLDSSKSITKSVVICCNFSLAVGLDPAHLPSSYGLVKLANRLNKIAYIPLWCFIYHITDVPPSKSFN